jgi:hypothetical protein
VGRYAVIDAEISHLLLHAGYPDALHSSDLPLARDPRMERAFLGLSPERRTPPLPATHVEVGTGR